MENLQRIALLIDADNTQLAKLEDVIQEISTHGRIVVKRAYGNWRKDTLKNWENELKRLAIKAEQQFDYVSGKNARSQKHIAVKCYARRTIKRITYCKNFI